MAAFPVPVDGHTASRFDVDLRPAQGHTVPVTCGACGCRLAESRAADGTVVWLHFAGLDGRDARGCSVVCSSYAHDANGDALSPV
jgi:hypothetical protein